jgi:hypothetical protein
MLLFEHHDCKQKCNLRRKQTSVDKGEVAAADRLRDNRLLQIAERGAHTALATEVRANKESERLGWMKAGMLP